MKITVSKKAISGALQHLCACAPRQTTMPILKCIKLVPAPNYITMRAANEGVRMSVECVVDATVSQPETICVGAHELFERVKAMPDGDIKLITKATKLSVESGLRKLGMSVQSGDDYPPIAEPEGATIMLPAELLSKAIRSTVFVCSDDQSDGWMCGLRLTLRGESLTSEACGRHRAALFASPAGDGELQCTIPKGPALMLKQLLDGATGEVSLRYSAPRVYAALPNGLSLSCAELGSVFQDVIGVAFSVADPNPCKVIADVAGGSLRAIAGVTDKLGTVHISRTGQNIRVTGMTMTGDESIDEFMAEEGADFEPVKLQANYLIDAIAACDSEVVTVSATTKEEGQNLPGPVRVSGGLTRHYIMPQVS